MACNAWRGTLSRAGSLEIAMSSLAIAPRAAVRSTAQQTKTPTLSSAPKGARQALDASFEIREGAAKIAARPVHLPDGRLEGYAPAARFALRVGALQARSIRADDRRERPLATPALALAAAADRLAVALEAVAADPQDAPTPATLAALRRLLSWAQAQGEAWRAKAEPANDSRRRRDAGRPLAGLRFIDLFAGAGGFHLGLSAAGAQCVAACEIDPDARETYARNFGEGFAFHEDVREMADAELPEADILCAGFPCQPFSKAGDGEGFAAEGKGDLFFHLMTIARRVAPAWMLLENVPAFAGHDGGRTMERALDEIEALGYEVSARKLDAGRFGVAQRRERLFILATRLDVADAARAKRRAPFAWPTGADDSAVVADILEEAANEPSLDGAFAYDRQEPVGPSREIERVGFVKGRKKAQGYRIYSPKGKAVTLCAGSGGLGGQTGLYRIDGQVRRLTGRECARLAGFGDDFELPASVRVARRLFGNCVVAPVIEAIAREAGRAYA